MSLSRTLAGGAFTFVRSSHTEGESLGGARPLGVAFWCVWLRVVSATYEYHTSGSDTFPG